MGVTSVLAVAAVMVGLAAVGFLIWVIARGSSDADAATVECVIDPSGFTARWRRRFVGLMNLEYEYFIGELPVRGQVVGVSGGPSSARVHTGGTPTHVRAWLARPAGTFDNDDDSIGFHFDQPRRSHSAGAHRQNDEHGAAVDVAEASAADEWANPDGGGGDFESPEEGAKDDGYSGGGGDISPTADYSAY